VALTVLARRAGVLVQRVNQVAENVQAMRMSEAVMSASCSGDEH
jgi:hypothetical protein